MQRNGWQFSEHLPPNWMFKDRSKANNGVISAHMKILASDGSFFSSLKAAEEYMGYVTGYRESDVKKLGLLGEELCTKRRSDLGEWEEVEGLPPGWKMKIQNIKDYYLAPDRQQMPGLRVALQHMIQNAYPESEIDTMRGFLLTHGWKTSEHLPPSWIYKEAISVKSPFMLLSSEGDAFQSFIKTRELLHSSEKYGPVFSDMFDVFCEEYKKDKNIRFWPTQTKIEDANKTIAKDNTTLPKGWRHGGSHTRDYIVSPNGQEFNSRLKALQSLIKIKSKPEDIEEMRRLTEHENFQESPFLPKDWIVKTWTDEEKGQDHSRVKFLSSEGDIIVSYKAAGAYMMKSSLYTDGDVKQVTELMSENSKQKRLYNHTEIQNKKMSTSLKLSNSRNKEFYIASDGTQFVTKRLALKFLLEKGFPQNEIENVRDSMERDGWKRDTLLPENWMYRSLNHRALVFITNEGDTLRGVQTCQEFIENNYDREEIKNFKSFLDIVSVKGRSNRYTWNDNDGTVPEGWKSRRTETKLYILSPDGQQFCSRKQCLQYMIRESFEQEEVEDMIKMCRHEGWETSDFLPKNWIIKTSKRFYKGLNTISAEIMSELGEVFDSYKTCISFMESRDEYSQVDINKILKLMDANTKYKNIPTKEAREQQWEEDGTLPPGWKVRKEERAGTLTEIFLSNQGKQLVSRASALAHMVSLCHPEEDLLRLRSGLAVFGWEEDPFLPEGWLTRFSPRDQRTLYLSPCHQQLDGSVALLEHLLDQGAEAGLVGEVARGVGWGELEAGKRLRLQKRVQRLLMG